MIRTKFILALVGALGVAELSGGALAQQRVRHRTRHRQRTHIRATSPESAAQQEEEGPPKGSGSLPDLPPDTETQNDDTRADAPPSTPAELPPVDLKALNDEFAGLMDELVQVRSRISLLGEQLFHTKVRVRLRQRTKSQQNQALYALELDGGSILRRMSSELDDEQDVFEGSLSPGPHELKVEVEQRSRKGEEFRYTLVDRYRFMAPRGKVTEVTVELEDGSDMGEAFPRRAKAEYSVRSRVRIVARP